MKKTIIAAGVVSAMVAAIPFTGVFAAETDTISVTISNNCAFTRKAYASGGVTNNTTHKNDQGTWGTASPNLDKLSITMTNGSTKTLGSSNFNVICNNKGGYSITANITPLSTSDATPKTIANCNSFTGNTSCWAPMLSSTAIVDPGTDPTVKTSTSPITSTDFEISYKVFVSSVQPSGTYTGTAAYTFAQL